jgi:hypothetical protein
VKMKKYTQTKVVLLALGAVALLSVVMAGGKASRPQDIPADRRAQTEAARRGGYRELAKMKGEVVVNQHGSSFVKFDLETITKKSAAVVIGTAVSNVSRLSPDGLQITTDYQVQVQEVLKGKGVDAGNIEVSLPGGRVVFEDGTAAQVNVPGFRRMENGKTYVLFLSERGPEYTSFAVTGGPQGIFEVVEGGLSVKPHGTGLDPLAQKYKVEKEARTFIKEARKAAKTWPEPSSCCQD